MVISHFPSLFLLVFFVFGCHHASTKTIIAHCTKDDAQKIADDLMNKKHYQLTTLNRTINETTEHYVVEYLLPNTRTLGGGAAITIAKKNCEVVDMQQYQ